MSDHPGKAFYEAVSTLLAGLAASSFGARELPSHTQRARFVWVPVSDDPEPYFHAQDVLGAFKERFSIEIRASGYDDAKWLQKALWTACFEAVRDPTLEGVSFIFGSGTHSGNQDSKFGYVIEQELALLCPVQKVSLTQPFAYNLAETTDITTSGFDADGETDGDGELVAPNN